MPCNKYDLAAQNLAIVRISKFILICLQFWVSEQLFLITRFYFSLLSFKIWAEDLLYHESYLFIRPTKLAIKRLIISFYSL